MAANLYEGESDLKVVDLIDWKVGKVRELLLPCDAQLEMSLFDPIAKTVYTLSGLPIICNSNTNLLWMVGHSRVDNFGLDYFMV